MASLAVPRACEPNPRARTAGGPVGGRCRALPHR